jgi:probable phosphoglycerate mutase
MTLGHDPEPGRPAPRAVLVRHGETAWTRTGRHTGRTDLPLSEEGEAEARRLGATLALHPVGAVFTSPRVRAVRTCELAGLGGKAVLEPDLAEWDYGDFEGLVLAEILQRRPGWRIFRDGCPGGESPSQVSDRADRVIARVRALSADSALFTHGHFGRALAARWIGLPVSAGANFLLGTASVSLLAYEHGDVGSPALALWNAPPGSGA